MVSVAPIMQPRGNGVIMNRTSRNLIAAATGLTMGLALNAASASAAITVSKAEIAAGKLVVE